MGCSDDDDVAAVMNWPALVTMDGSGNDLNCCGDDLISSHDAVNCSGNNVT